MPGLRRVGAHALRCTACAGIVLAAEAGSASADLIQGPATYRLHNHPDGEAAPPLYGLRLDELISVTSGHDIFTFDFDHALSDMTLHYDGASTIHITGTAFGGLDIGDEYDPGYAGVATIDFTWTTVAAARSDDDLIVTTPNFTNTGTIMFLGRTIDLFDRANDEGYTFRFGDENNDAGHRDFPGISGWGWLDHGEPGNHIHASDWIFTAEQIPAPATVALLAGLWLAPRRRRT